ncbi:unnamed protein product [Amoebophrya sp. A25]|nr:unnamed protein product [Amoebophrya sp. A25]|eukprot:GSA25T00001631001.1
MSHGKKRLLLNTSSSTSKKNAPQQLSLSEVQMLVAIGRARLLLDQSDKFETVIGKAESGLRALFAERREMRKTKGSATTREEGSTEKKMEVLEGDAKMEVDEEEDSEEDSEDEEHSDDGRDDVADAQTSKVVDALDDPAATLQPGIFQLHVMKDLDAEIKRLRFFLKKSSTENIKREDFYSQFAYLHSAASVSDEGEQDQAGADPRALRTIGYRGDRVVEPELRNVSDLISVKRNEVDKDPSSAKKITKIELGPGLGEWVLQKATSEPDTLFVACELRHERCVRIWQDCVLQGLKNVIVLGGDATKTLEALKISASAGGSQQVDLVVSNFPQPPTWHQKSAMFSSSTEEQDGQHLLTADFINTQVYALLGRPAESESAGTFLVFSDNREYLNWMAREVFNKKVDYTGRRCSWADAGAVLLDEDKKSSKKDASSSTIKVHTGRPTECEMEEKTYFDRMWSQGKKKDRCFIRVRRAPDLAGPRA